MSLHLHPAEVIIDAIFSLEPLHDPEPRPVASLELEMKAIRRFAKVSIVSYSRPSLIIIASATQFHVYLPWGQRLFSIVS